MKILQVITSLYTGGAEKLMLEIIPKLKEEGHQVDLLLLDGNDTPFYQEARKLKIKVYDLGKNKNVYSPFKLLKLLSFPHKYDIIHTHNTAPQFFAAISTSGKKIKLITTEHNTSNRRRDIKLFKPFDKWMYNRYEGIICISKQAEVNLREYLGSCKAEICTINNGINVRSVKEAKPTDELEGIAPNSKKIIMVAAFRWEKDQPTLIKALKYMPSHFHLFLVGDGARREELEKLINGEGLSERVHLLGIRNDVPNILHAADYIVMSSHFEGLSLSSVEGMCVNKPFLASDVDGLHDVVEGAGVLFPHGDSRTLAEEILKLDEDKEYYSKVAADCLERAKEYDIDKMVSGYLNLYNRVYNAI